MVPELTVTKKIIKNTIYLLSSDVLTKTLGFIYTIYLAKHLGAEGFGILSFSIAFTGLFAIFIDMGLSNLATREIARNYKKTSKYISNIIAIKLVLVPITIAIIFASINLLKYSPETKIIIYIFGFVIGINSFIQIISSMFSAYERLDYVSVKRIINSIVMVIGVLVGIQLNLSIENFALIYLLAHISMLTYLLILMRKIDIKIEINYKFSLNLLKASFPFALVGAFSTIYYKTDSVMLSYFIGDSAVGYYNAAYTLIITLLFIPEAYLEAIFPVMSKLYTKQDLADQLDLLYKNSTKYMIGIGTPICIGTSLLAEKIIVLFYGIDFIPSTISLQILIWSTLFMFLNLLFSNFLASINKQSIAVKAIGIGVSVNIILNYIMIPKLSSAGASLATLITEIVILGIYIRYLHVSKYGFSVDIKALLKVILSCIIMGLYLSYFTRVNILLLIVSATIIYFLMLYALGWIGQFEKEVFVNLLGIKKMKNINISK